MDIQRQSRHFPYGLQYHRTDGDIRYKVTIHDINVQKLCAGVFDLANVVPKGCKVSGKD
jgi:hypothetical protein